MLTVGQLREIMFGYEYHEIQKKNNKHYVSGIAGLARLLDCSRATANRIKASGVLNAATKQIGRKILFDAEMVLELISKDDY